MSPSPKKNSPDQEQDAPNIGASRPGDINPPKVKPFDYLDRTVDSEEEGEKGEDSTPLTYDLNDEDLDFFEYIRDFGGDDDKRRLGEAARKLLPNLLEQFQEARETPPEPDIPQWKDRTTGRKLSPVDWIVEHYGEKGDDGVWNGLGVTQADIRRDIQLYDAYRKWIKAHPKDDLGLPKAKRRKTADPEETVRRNRESSLRSYYKRKNAL